MTEAATSQTGNEFDIVILGAGSGGYACALRAAQLGLSVALVEKGNLGGTCLHVGCIPTKALLHAAEVADSARESEQFGVKATLRRHRHGRRQLLQGRRRLPAVQGAHRPDQVPRHHRRRGRGPAHRRPTTVEVAGTTYTGKHVVLASGSYRKSLPGLEVDGERVLTSEHALQLDRVPASVIVLGGGVIGCEFASVWKLLRRRRHHRRGAPPAGRGRGRGRPRRSLERAFRKRKITLPHRHPVRVGRDAPTPA